MSFGALALLLAGLTPAPAAATDWLVLLVGREAPPETADAAADDGDLP